MHTDGVLNIFGKLLLLISISLLSPIPFSLYYHDALTGIFLTSAFIGALLGALLVGLFVPNRDLGYRDGFAVVVLSWLGMALLGALPYYLSGYIPNFTDALFESMSGFTTTGSTILSEVEILPKSLLFWRAMTHWLGGMGIIVLSLAILPLLGVAGMQLFQAEVPGPTKDRLAPRMQDTARILWGVYFLFTLVETALLMFGGLDFFEAVCHSFASLATGGFSTHTASAGYFQSAYIEGVIILFMFLAGMNFSLHYQGLHGKFSAYWQSEEFRLYLLLNLLPIAIIALVNLNAHIYTGLVDSIRAAAFQVVSIITTTGFGTADFDKWPAVCKFILVAIMFVGGCAGSTGGGIKVVRVLLFFKYARIQIRSLNHPNSVNTIKMGRIKVPQEIMMAILGFFALYFGLFILASLLVTALGVDLLTGTTAVIATLNNIGPGLAQVGPAQNFGGLPAAAKLILTFCMLAGRLELYAVAIMLSPDFWKMARRPTLRWQRN